MFPSTPRPFDYFHSSPAKQHFCTILFQLPSTFNVSRNMVLGNHRNEWAFSSSKKKQHRALLIVSLGMVESMAPN